MDHCAVPGRACGERGVVRVLEKEVALDDPAVWLQGALHDLCQPLTALECGLFVGTMSPDGVRGPGADELMATILGALAQCERITSAVRAIQVRLQETDSQ